MKKYLYHIIALFFTVSCVKNFSEKSISEFKIDGNALKDRELVEVIHAPVMPIKISI